MSANKSPVFPIPAESHHFGDYGFDPQIDYFQVLEEAKRHRRDNDKKDDNINVSMNYMMRSMDSLHLKLEKQATSSSKDDNSKKSMIKWWRNVKLFLRRRLVKGSRGPRPYDNEEDEIGIGGIEQIRCRGRSYLGSISGPVYLTESRGSGSGSGSSTPYRSSSGPVSRTLTPTRIGGGEVEIPYISLRELNMENQHHDQLYKGTRTNSSMPIYLVT